MRLLLNCFITKRLLLKAIAKLRAENMMGREHDGQKTWRAENVTDIKLLVHSTYKLIHNARNLIATSKHNKSSHFMYKTFHGINVSRLRHIRTTTNARKHKRYIQKKERGLRKADIFFEPKKFEGNCEIFESFQSETTLPSNTIAVIQTDISHKY